ncbi:MAG: hypothetical protein AAFN77_02225 [Planctomycetota bacterium]
MAESDRKLVKRRPVDPTRHYKIAMVLSSLLLGLLVLFNCDRTLHRETAEELSFKASQHGWPRVFLEREFKPEVSYFSRAERSYDWPWPYVEGEIRRWNYLNLTYNLLAAGVIVVIFYWFVRTVVLRFDTWRAAQST